MKARKLRELLNETGYAIADYGDYVGIGNGYVHDLIKLEKSTLKISYALDTFKKGKGSLQNDDLLNLWENLENIISSGQIKEILEGDDEIENPVKVYSVKNGELIEHITDKPGWPNVTSSGIMMYNNEHFTDPKRAIENEIENLKYSIKSLSERLIETKVKVKKVSSDIRKRRAELDKLSIFKIPE